MSKECSCGNKIKDSDMICDACDADQLYSELMRAHARILMLEKENKELREQNEQPET